MLTLQEEQLIMMLPDTDYGRAFFKWVALEIEKLERKEEHGGKISNDPLIEDFRTQMGIKIGLRRVLRKPDELKQKLLQGAHQK